MDPLALLQGTQLAWLLPYAGTVVALCSLIDALFPQPCPGSRWWALRQAISRLACNVGHATNAPGR